MRTIHYLCVLTLALWIVDDGQALDVSGTEPQDVANLQTGPYADSLMRKVRRRRVFPGQAGGNVVSDHGLLRVKKKRPVKLPTAQPEFINFSPKLKSPTTPKLGVRPQFLKRKVKLRRKKVPAKQALVMPSALPQTFGEDANANNRTLDEKRFLSLFTIVTFRNDPCFSSTGVNGTCYSSTDCSNLGGTASGGCASGFGVCCIFTAGCGRTVSQNCTFFQSTGYPSTFDSVGSCQLTVAKNGNNVCQLRLDFDNFVLAGPETTENVCQDDQFIVTGGAPIPAICGVNTGQHLFVDAGLNSNSPCILNAVTSGASFARSFNIKVTQIPCSSLNRAPDGCTQYLTGVSGRVQSFNYNNAGGLQLSNTQYSICFRMERNFCGIQYTACPDAMNTPAMSFSVTGSIATMVGSVVGTSCSTDWITIPCATNTNDIDNQSDQSTCVDRICGMVFNSITSGAGSASTSVTSFSKPFVIFVRTDNQEGTSTPTEDGNVGFCLDYVQQPCTATTG